MDRSAHVWGKYKALLTVISSYNWWVVFPYISFSWLTAFLKSRLNGKLIGWLNLHFNQSIYDGGSPRNSLAEGEATFPEGLGQGGVFGICPLTYYFSCYLSKSICTGKGRELQWPPHHWPHSHTPINLRENGPDACLAQRMEPQSHLCVFCHWVSNASPTGSPAWPSMTPKLPHQGVHVWGRDILAREACFSYFLTGLTANPTNSKETSEETRASDPEEHLLAYILNGSHFKHKIGACTWIVSHSNSGSIRGCGTVREHFLKGSRKVNPHVAIPFSSLWRRRKDPSSEIPIGRLKWGASITLLTNSMSPRLILCFHITEAAGPGWILFVY